MPDFEIFLPYGKDTLHATLKDVESLGVLDIADTPALVDPAAHLRAVISPPFIQTLKAKDRVCIVVSDSFRYTGMEQLLPELLGTLGIAGIQEESICFLYATGSHRGPTAEEAVRILGEEVFRRFEKRAYTHDPNAADDLVYLGTTRRGTPVEINRRAVECDKLIVTGTVVLHYFGGFGGGRKSLLPGIASSKSIAHNHSLNLHATENKRNPEVKIGRLDGNPVAEDMLEGGLMCKTHLMINTVLNRQGKIAGVFAGDLEEAHNRATDFAASLYQVPIPEQADLVIASAGAAKNFIQSHKSLFNAYQAMKPGGRLILAAPAPEGLGGDRFKHWLGLGSIEAIFEELRRQAEINGQTALSTLEKAPATTLITEMSPEEVQRLGAKAAPTLQEAVDQAIGELRGRGITRPKVYIMPSAGYTVPV